VTRPELGRARWKRVRLTILERDGHTCQLCGRPADTVDHIQPAAYGGDDSPENLRALCRSCNASLGARVRADLAAVRRANTYREGGASFWASASTPAPLSRSLSPRGSATRSKAHVHLPGLLELEDGHQGSRDDPDQPET